MSSTTTNLPRSGSFGTVDTIAISSATVGVAPIVLAVDLATLQVVAAAYRERVVGAAVVTGTLAGTDTGATTATCPHPPAGPSTCR
jgi:hypothetical protein